MKSSYFVSEEEFLSLLTTFQFVEVAKLNCLTDHLSLIRS